MTEQPVVGRFYLVPAVETSCKGYSRFVPVIGGLHEDSALINFPHKHYHIDWRFVAQVDWTLATFWRKSPHGRVLTLDHVVGPVHKRRMRCKRWVPAFPRHEPPWMDALDRAYCTHIANGGICPHRGVDLKDQPVIDGIVTCPAHGLRFRAADWHPVTFWPFK